MESKFNNTKSPVLQKATLRDENGYVILPRTVSSAITMDDKEYDEPITLAEQFSEIKDDIENKLYEVNNLKNDMNLKADKDHTHEQYLDRVQVAEMISTAQLPELNRSAIDIIFDNKVDKVEGKGLSTEDFTTEEKEKLNNLSTNDIKETPEKVFFTPKERLKLARLGNGDFSGSFYDLYDVPDVYFKEDVDKLLEEVEEKILDADEIKENIQNKFNTLKIYSDDIIQKDQDYKLVTEKEKKSWNNKLDSDEFKSYKNNFDGRLKILEEDRPEITDKLSKLETFKDDAEKRIDFIEKVQAIIGAGHNCNCGGSGDDSESGGSDPALIPENIATKEYVDEQLKNLGGCHCCCGGSGSGGSGDSGSGGSGSGSGGGTDIEIPDNIATIEYVDEKVAPLATKDMLKNLATIDYVDGQIVDIITGGDISLDGYVTKAEFENSDFITQEILDEFGNTIGIRFEDYYNKAEMDSKLKVALDEISAQVHQKYETKDNVLEYINASKENILNLTKEEIEAKFQAAKDEMNKDTDQRLDELNRDLTDKINSIDVGSRNYIVVYTAEKDKILNTESGVLETLVGSYTTDYIKVDPSTDYVLSCMDNAAGKYVIAYFDAGKNFISAISEETRDNMFVKNIKTISTCAYVRISCPNINKTKFEKGVTATDWTQSPEDQLHSVATKVERDEVYLKGEVYNKTEIESKLAVTATSIEALNRTTNEMHSDIETLRSETTSQFEQMDSKFSLKANVTDVYTKSETMSSEEILSKLSIAKGEIELAVSNKYETKENVETKITQLTTTIEGEINDAIDSAVTQSSACTAELLKNYYTKSEAEAKFTVTTEGIQATVDKAIETSTTLEERITNLNESLSQKIAEMSGSRNLMIIYTATANKSLSSTDGTLADNAGYKTSDYIKVDPSTEYAISYYGSVMGTYTVAYYTESKTFISAETFNDEDVLAFKQTVTTPGTCLYVRISCPDYDWTKFAIGSTFTDWTAAPEDTLNSLGTKADKNEVYTKSEVTELLNTKASLSIKDEILLAVSGTYETKANVVNQINNITEGKITEKLKTYYTKAETDAAIKVAKDNIELGVSTNYVSSTTLTDRLTEVNTAISNAQTNAVNTANTNVTETLKSYYTSSQTDSKIKAAKDEVSLSVSNTYETKTSASTTKTTLQNAITTAKGEAIDAAAADATTKANNAQTAAVNSAKANLTQTLQSYYTKEQTNAQIKASVDGITLDTSSISESIETAKNTAITTATNNAKANVAETLKSYYTKEQTDSKINLAKDSITQTVSSTYVTKSNVNTIVADSINAITIGGRNLAQQTSDTYDLSYNSFSNKTNECISLYNVLTNGLNIGDTINVSFTIKLENMAVDATNGKKSFSVQGAGDVTSWTNGTFPDKTITFETGNTKEIKVDYTSSPLDANHIKNKLWQAQLRFDYVTSGKFSIKEFKVEKGNQSTAWTAAPEDQQANLDEAMKSVNANLKDIIDQQQQSMDRLQLLENDAIITPSEKNTISYEYDLVKMRYQAALLHYDAVGDSSCSNLKEYLTTTYNNLVTVMNTVLKDMSSNTEYSMAEINNKFKNFYDANESLIARLNASLGETVKNNTSKITQLSDSVDISLTKAETALGKTETFGKHFKFSDSGWVEIYASKDGSEGRFKTQITDQKLAFLDNNVEVASISNQKLLISDAQINNTLKIGNMTLKPSASGGIIMVKE